jgi:hypothetical protein
MRLTGGKRLAVVASAVVALACAPAAASAATFGADLNQPANNTATCGEGFAPFKLHYASCTWNSGGPGPTFYAPAPGTVTAVRVKVGAVTGPMQVIVVRSLYQNKAGDPGHPYFACCFIERYGPVFTPQSNTITTVAVNLPMIEEATPPPDDTTTNAAGDQLALSVLADNVPVPAFVDKASGIAAFYPAPTEATNPAPTPNPLTPTTLFGGQVLMNADLDTGGAAPAGGAAPVPAVSRLPAVTLPKLTIPVRGNAATVPIQCLVLNCSGLLNLQSAQLAGAAQAAAKKKAKKPKVLSYGTASFSIKAGTTGKVKVKLNAAGRRLVKAHKKSKVWANVRFSSGGGRPTSTRLTLKR